MKTTHTHRGTCQACGKVQAVDNNSKVLAKHGYKVNYGAFQFVCRGADRYQPAELDVSLCTKTMADCLTSAAHNEEQVPKLRSGEIVPATFERWNKEKVKTTRTRWGTTTSTGDYDTLPIAMATPDELKARVVGQIRYHKDQAEGLREHERFLRTQVLPRLGQPLYGVVELEALKAAPKPVATVDVKAAKVTGSFPTKQARKDALDKLNRSYEKAHKAIRDIYLAIDPDNRTEAQREVYYGPMQLNHWRAKHSEATLREFPQAAPYVTEIESLVKAREAVKAAP